ncbi:hypothetical protein OAB63_00880 [Alphaproteobacteria bacterium]|nr:hypothetical protein [Alphaproteobacteria bacterium]
MIPDTSIYELNSHRLYLEELDKSQVIHIIKYTTYLIEKNSFNFLENFSEEDLVEVNKVSLTNDINNNLFFKYRKKKLSLSTIAIIQNNNLLIFTNSILFNFKLRNPIVVKPVSKDQNLVIKLFYEALVESEINNRFVKII